MGRISVRAWGSSKNSGLATGDTERSIQLGWESAATAGNWLTRVAARLRARVGCDFIIMTAGPSSVEAAGSSHLLLECVRELAWNDRWKGVQEAGRSREVLPRDNRRPWRKRGRVNRRTGS